MKSEAPAPKGPVTAASKTGGPGAASDPGAPSSDAGAPLVIYETDDETPVAIDAAAAGEGSKGPLLAVIRFDDGRPTTPGAADLEALAPERAGTAKTLGAPRPLAPESIPAPPSGRRTVRSLREASARIGAEKLLVVRFIRSGKERLLEASLHDVASGEVLGRYGPSEPSMSIAAAALHRLVK